MLSVPHRKTEACWETPSSFQWLELNCVYNGLWDCSTEKLQGLRSGWGQSRGTWEATSNTEEFEEDRKELLKKHLRKITCLFGGVGWVSKIREQISRGCGDSPGVKLL